MPKNAIGHALSLLNRVSSSTLLDRLHARKLFDQVVYAGSRGLFTSGSAVRRRFKPLLDLKRPTRLGRADAPKLFDLTLSDEQNMFVDALRRVADEQLRPAAEQADADDAAPDSVLAAVHELGLLTMAVPEAAGGAGEQDNSVLNMLAAEQLARGDMGLALAALAPLGVANAIVRYGNAAQQSRYLPALLEDNPATASLLVNEPVALFDPFRLRSRATRRGDGYVLNGHKILGVRAQAAELLVVAAELEGEGPALFMVETAAAGVRSKPAPGMGLRAAGLASCQFENLQLAADTRLGSAEDYHDFISRSRIAWAALTCGCAQAVLDYVIPYVKERKAFGEPIAHRQAVAFMVANIGIELEGLRLLTWRAASRAEQDLSFHREAWLAQQQAAEMGMRIGSDGVQLLGGHGFIQDHPVERWYRDLRAAAIGYGGLII